jgi:hypothetical protein
MREHVKPGLGRRLVGLIYNNRNDGPPDLDELWRDFNKKLSGLFGGKGGGAGRPAPAPGPTIAVAAGVVAAPSSPTSRAPASAPG